MHHVFRDARREALVMATAFGLEQGSEFELEMVVETMKLPGLRRLMPGVS
jgi:hypothetical protein